MGGKLLLATVQSGSLSHVTIYQHLPLTPPPALRATSPTGGGGKTTNQLDQVPGLRAGVQCVHHSCVRAPVDPGSSPGTLWLKVGEFIHALFLGSRPHSHHPAHPDENRGPVSYG
jgi:hypothetical protein